LKEYGVTSPSLAAAVWGPVFRYNPTQTRNKRTDLDLCRSWHSKEVQFHSGQPGFYMEWSKGCLHSKRSKTCAKETFYLRDLLQGEEEEEYKEEFNGVPKMLQTHLPKMQKDQSLPRKQRLPKMLQKYSPRMQKDQKLPRIRYLVWFRLLRRNDPITRWESLPEKTFFWYWLLTINSGDHIDTGCPRSLAQSSWYTHFL